MSASQDGDAYSVSLLVTSNESILHSWAQLCPLVADHAYDKGDVFLVGTQRHLRTNSVWALRALNHCERDNLSQQLRWIDTIAGPYADNLLKFKEMHSCTIVISVWAIIFADVPGFSVDLSWLRATLRCYDRIDLRAERLQDYDESRLPW